MKAVIFDLDGTMCDVRTIKHWVLDPATRDLHRYHAESANCPSNPDVVTAAHAAHRAGRAVLIVTAREEIFGDLSAAWLKTQGVEFDRMYMRKTDDTRPDNIIKKELLDQIRADGYNPIMAYDDNLEVVEVWRAAGIETIVVEGYGFD